MCVILKFLANPFSQTVPQLGFLSNVCPLVCIQFAFPYTVFLQCMCIPNLQVWVLRFGSRIYEKYGSDQKYPIIVSPVQCAAFQDCGHAVWPEGEYSGLHWVLIPVYYIFVQILSHRLCNSKVSLKCINSCMHSNFLFEEILCHRQCHSSFSLLYCVSLGAYSGAWILL